MVSEGRTKQQLAFHDSVAEKLPNCPLLLQRGRQPPVVLMSVVDHPIDCIDLGLPFWGRSGNWANVARCVTPR